MRCCEGSGRGRHLDTAIGALRAPDAVRAAHDGIDEHGVLVDGHTPIVQAGFDGGHEARDSALLRRVHVTREINDARAAPNGQLVQFWTCDLALQLMQARSAGVGATENRRGTRVTR